MNAWMIIIAFNLNSHVMSSMFAYSRLMLSWCTQKYSVCIAACALDVHCWKIHFIFLHFNCCWHFFLIRVELILSIVSPVSFCVNWAVNSELKNIYILFCDMMTQIFVADSRKHNRECRESLRVCRSAESSVKCGRQGIKKMSSTFHTIQMLVLHK